MKKCEHDLIEDECLPCLRGEIEDLRDMVKFRNTVIIDKNQRITDLENFMGWLVDGYGYQEHPVFIKEKAASILRPNANR